jgi:uncharacterized protein (TIGR02466 family)
MNLDLFFPTPIWWKKTDLNVTDIAGWCQQVKRQDPKGVALSNIGGWQSKDFKPVGISELDLLKQTIFELSSRCIKDMGIKTEGAKLNILNMWININQKDNYNNVHIHHHATMSGVFYVQCNKDSGRIEFYRNFSDLYIIESYGDIEKSTHLSHSVAGYDPEPGLLLLFPAHIPHGVKPNMSDTDRISIAFNIGFSYNE